MLVPAILVCTVASIVTPIIFMYDYNRCMVWVAQNQAQYAYSMGGIEPALVNPAPDAVRIYIEPAV